MIRRSLNWKVVLATFAVGTLSVLALFLLHSWQLSRTAKGLLVLSEAKEKESDWLKAAEYLDRYLRLRPDDVAVRERLALTYGRGAAQDEASQQQKRRAIELHYRALATGVTKQEVELRCELAELLLDTGQFTNAEKEAQQTLAAVGADDPKALRVLALALVSQLADGSLAGKKTEELRLVKTVEHARQLNSADVRLARVLATLYREFPQAVLAEYRDLTEPARQQRANDSLDSLVQDNLDSAPAYLARYEYRTQYGLSGASTDLEAALRLDSTNSAVQLACAVAAYNQAVATRVQPGEAAPTAQQLFEQSRDHYQQLLALPTKKHLPQYYLGLGNAFAGLEQVDKALSIWREGIQHFQQPTNRVAFHARIADVCIDKGLLSDAERSLSAIDEIISGFGGSVPRRERLQLTWAQDLRRALWHQNRQQFAEAVPLLRRVVTQTKGEADVQPAFRALFNLGSVYAALGEWRDAAVSFDQASGVMPNLQPAAVAAADSWLRAGRADLALERAEQALNLSGTVEAWSTFALAQFRFQLSRPIEDRSWIQFERALKALETMRDQHPGARPWQIDFLRADYLLVTAKQVNDARNVGADAVEVLRRCEQAFASQKEVWADLCVAYQRLKRNLDADRALNEFQKAGGTGIELVLLESQLASLRGDDEAAKTVVRQAAKSLSTNDQGKLRQELLRLMLVTKDLVSARALLLEEHAQRPHQLMILRQLAELDLERRSFDDVALWEKKMHLEGVIGEQAARYYRARRMFDSEVKNDSPALREALRDLEQVVLAQPNWSEAASLKAMTEHRLGQIDAAVADYERAVQLGERRLIVFEQLIGLLDRLQRPADVERYLARLETDQPLSQRLAEIAADHEVRRDRPERALEIARRSALARPADADAQLWLGRLLLVTNNLGDAEHSFRKSIELKPANAGGWNGLLTLHARSRNRDGLEVILRQLEANTALAGAQKSLLIGQTHVSLGNLEEAKSSFVQAANQGQNDLVAQLSAAQFFLQQEPARAKSYLEAALRIDPKSTAARRLSAIVNASQGDLDATARLLTEASPDGTLSTEDVRLHAILLLQQGGQANLERAAALLEDLVAREHRHIPIDHLLLARLYEQQAQITDQPQTIEQKLKRAEQEFLSLADRPTADPAHLAAFVQFLIRHEKSEEATAWLTKFEQRVESLPNKDPGVVSLLIQTQIQHGSPDRTETWLKTLESIDAEPLRPLALRAEAAIRRDAHADIERLVEPRAAVLVATAKTPEDKQQVYRGVGNLYMAVKQHRSAERWYRLLQAENAKQYATVVSSLARQGRLQEAIDLWEQMARTDESVQSIVVLATALIEGNPTARDFERTKPILDAAVVRFDSDANLLYAVGLVRLVEGNAPDSVDLFRKIVKINPRFIPALNNLAIMLAERAVDQQEALQMIDRALDLAGKDATLLDTKGTILVYSGRSREAIPLLESAIRDSQADPRHHFHLALAYRDQGKTEEAKVQLKTALDRKLISLMLTPTDKRLLLDLRSALQL